MATHSSLIFDLFLSLINDYKLNTIYSTSGSATFTTYIQPWLLYSTDEFSDICDQDLTYDTTTQSFDEDLTSRNQLVLARIMTKYWLQKEVQDVLQMQLNLQDKDFKTFAESFNLREKQQFYLAKCEEIDRLLTNYGIKTNNWDNWVDQIFTP
jgi:hypothetical protein